LRVACTHDLLRNYAYGTSILVSILLKCGSLLPWQLLLLILIDQGRLLNRFTHDAEILDITLVWSMSMLLISASWFLTGVIVIIGILPWMILAMIPVAIVYWMIQNKYRKSGADLQRIDALSRSPLQAMLAEGIEGSATIRSFRKEETFTKRFHSFVDRNISAQLNFISAQRWLGIRIELLGVTIVFTATLLVIVFNEVFGLSAGLVALLIRWSSSLTISLSFFMDNAAETEGAITAIERIKNMSETPQEPNFERTKELSDPWPSKGELEFRDVQMRYRSLLPLALDGLSFRVEAGKHCGVVGRTGAGKSSLSVAMFRLVEVEAGAVLVDGVDLSTLGLSDVRGRPNGIAIIPQDPFLFAGTMRECLDPFNACTDEKLLEALLSVRMLGPGKGKEFLDTHVEEGGANYSVGERSLLVLARAMLARPKLLVMDEATGK
jgi:ABC-type multidrug transport system fused ATPase/permease subunit